MTKNMNDGSAQAELDRCDIAPGYAFPCDDVLVGNCTPEQPLLAPVGVDRYGRFWQFLWRDGRGAYQLLSSTPSRPFGSVL